MAELVLEETIELDGRQAVLLTLNRPEKFNAVIPETVVLLREKLQRLSNSGVGAVVLTGAGRAFCAGGDLSRYQVLFDQPHELERYMDDFMAVCELLETIPAATFAMVNGVCVAGGLELALACDAILVADSARIGDGHLRFGQIGGTGGTQRLSRAIGYQRAKYWLLSGRLFSAEQAVADGLAVEAVPAADLRARTLKLAAEAARHSPLGVGISKKLIRAAVDETRPAGFERERRLVFDYVTTSDDAREGLAAFVAGRNQVFTGR
ncbi:MAG: enoyl-CoA hydratase/isomerase family protein [Hyphomicrobiales bacterium]|nr:MAG: enoyl-CoA hydratase/isomerase family protein [Hyphomicrobiales bacterium]